MELPEIQFMCNDIENVYAVTTVGCFTKVISVMHKHGDKLLRLNCTVYDQMNYEFMKTSF